MGVGPHQQHQCRNKRDIRLPEVPVPGPCLSMLVRCIFLVAWQSSKTLPTNWSVCSTGKECNIFFISGLRQSVVSFYDQVYPPRAKEMRLTQLQKPAEGPTSEPWPMSGSA